MNDEAFRNVAADSMAQGFVVEILLSQYLKQFAGDSREEVCRSLISTGQRTEHFAGLAKDEETAELFADVVVRMHAALEGLVSRAAARLETSR
jgi:hypothetical protein